MLKRHLDGLRLLVYIFLNYVLYQRLYLVKEPILNTVKSQYLLIYLVLHTISRLRVIHMSKQLIVIITVNLSLLIFLLMVQSFLKKKFTYLIFKMSLYLIRLFLFCLKIRSNLLLLLSYQHLEIIQRQLIIYSMLRIKVINCFTLTSLNLTTTLYPLNPSTTYLAYCLLPLQLLIQFIVNCFFYNYLVVSNL